MTKITQELNPISQAEKSQNFRLTDELLVKMINNLSIQNGSNSSIKTLGECLFRLELSMDDEFIDQKLVRECLYKELQKITFESTGNNWDKNHKFNKELTIEQLFNWLETLQCGRIIKNQRRLAGLND